MPQITHLEELSTEALLDFPPPNLILKTRLCPIVMRTNNARKLCKEAQKLYSIKIWYDKDAGWNTLQDRLRFHHPAARSRLEHEVPVLHFAGEACDRILHHEDLLQYVRFEPDDLPLLHIHFVPDAELMQSAAIPWVQAPALPLLRPFSPESAGSLVVPRSVSAVSQRDNEQKRIESTSSTDPRNRSGRGASLDTIDNREPGPSPTFNRDRLSAGIYQQHSKAQASSNFRGTPQVNKRRLKVLQVHSRHQSAAASKRNMAPGATAPDEEQGKDSDDTDDEDTIVVKRPEKVKDKEPRSRFQGGRFATTSKTNLSKTRDFKTDSSNIDGTTLQPKSEIQQPDREKPAPFYVRIGTAPNLIHQAETPNQLDCNLIAIAEVSPESQVRYLFAPTWFLSGIQVGSLWNAQEAMDVYKLPTPYRIEFDPYFQIGFRENHLEQSILDCSKKKATQTERRKRSGPEKLPLLFHGANENWDSSQSMVASPLSYDVEDKVNLVVEFADRNSSPRKRRFPIDTQMPVDVNCSHYDFLEQLWDMEMTEDGTSLSELFKSGGKDARMEIWVLPQGTEGPWRQLTGDGVLRDFCDEEIWQKGERSLYVEVHLFGM